MPSLFMSQESFNEILPSFQKRSSKPVLRTTRVKHLSLHDGEDYELIKQITSQINKSRKIITLTGAGISCNAGIPDFRSSNGIYNQIKGQYPNVYIKSGKDMFDISLFREESKISVFATFMEKLYSDTKLAKPTRSHKFIAHLKNRGKLLHCYTQNIDGLEEFVGLELSRIVDQTSSFVNQWRKFDVIQLHGDLNYLSCTQCFQTFNWSRFWKRCLRNGELPVCPRCQEINIDRCNKGKRVAGNVGILRPNIVLYGEDHPCGEFITQGLNIDINKGKPDLLLIMGTSLKVDGVKKLVRNISRQIHERGGLVLLINKTNIGDCNWHGLIDYQFVCDCDDWVIELEKHIPSFFLTQQQVGKLRQLKRTASDLKKKEKELKILEDLQKTSTKRLYPINTSNPTPKKFKSGSIELSSGENTLNREISQNLSIHQLNMNILPEDSMNEISHLPDKRLFSRKDHSDLEIESNLRFINKVSISPTELSSTTSKICNNIQYSLIVK